MNDIIFRSSATENQKKHEINGAFDAYKTALEFGRDGGDCVDLFPNCPNTPTQLMSAFSLLESRAVAVK